LMKKNDFCQNITKNTICHPIFLVENAVTCFNLNDPNLLVKMF